MTDSERQVAELSSPREFEWITYEQFGAEFVSTAVTTDRISAAIEGMTGRGIKIGPFTIGPGGLAGAVAEGAVGTPVVTRRDGDSVTFDVVVPVSLSVVVRLGSSKFQIEIGVEISLVLTARAADPLLIVIDIPPITHRAVKLVVRAEALGAAGEWVLEPIGRIIRNEVATRLNTMLADPAAVKGRIFDVAAMTDGRKQVRPDGTDFRWLTDAEFGAQFFRHAVDEQRIREALGGLTGRKIEIGPMQAGPGKIAEVTANGLVDEPRIKPRAGDSVMFDLVIPAAVDLVITLAKENRYQAEIDIELILTARAAEPLLIVIDVPKVSAADIDVVVKSKGLSARMVGVVGGVRKQIADQVARVVNKQLADPTRRVVDVADRISGAV